MSELAGPYAGLPIGQARAAHIEDLPSSGLILDRQPNHATPSACMSAAAPPIEYLVSGQWFIGVLDAQSAMLRRAAVAGIPATCGRATRAGWQDLAWDWNISRQRYYGVPFPLWYCEDCDQVMLARRERVAGRPQLPHSRPQPAPACGGTTAPSRDRCDGYLGHLIAYPPYLRRRWPRSLGWTRQRFTTAAHVAAAQRARHHSHLGLLQHRAEPASTTTAPWREVMIAGHAQDPAGRSSANPSSRRRTIRPRPSSTSRRRRALLDSRGAHGRRYHRLRGSLPPGQSPGHQTLERGPLRAAARNSSRVPTRKRLEWRTAGCWRAWARPWRAPRRRWKTMSRRRPAPPSNASSGPISATPTWSWSSTGSCNRISPPSPRPEGPEGRRDVDFAHGATRSPAAFRAVSAACHRGDLP